MPSVAANAARPASSACRNEDKSWPKVSGPPLSELRNLFVSELRFLLRDSRDVALVTPASLILVLVNSFYNHEFQNIVLLSAVDCTVRND